DGVRGELGLLRDRVPAVAGRREPDSALDEPALVLLRMRPTLELPALGKLLLERALLEVAEPRVLRLAALGDQPLPDRRAWRHEFSHTGRAAQMERSPFCRLVLALDGLLDLAGLVVGLVPLAHGGKG